MSLLKIDLTPEMLDKLESRFQQLLPKSFRLLALLNFHRLLGVKVTFYEPSDADPEEDIIFATIEEDIVPSTTIFCKENPKEVKKVIETSS